MPRTGLSGPSPGRGPQVTRRVLLGLAAAAALAGCSRKRPQELRPLPDVGVLLGAIAAEERLIALYESTRAAHPDLAGRLDPMLSHHRDHLTVLRRHYVPGTAETQAPATPAPTAGASGGRAGTTVAPRGRRRAVAALRTAERDAAAARSADVTRVSAGMAQLFASIGACEAGHATWLKRLA
ncbi:MAG TPA: hypothetical protein VFU43_17635 [Streptosporangiaceae bacterium]|nr:hypothetical protein [Streptosporangiaceae bacterium]